VSSYLKRLLDIAESTEILKKITTMIREPDIYSSEKSETRGKLKILEAYHKENLKNIFCALKTAINEEGTAASSDTHLASEVSARSYFFEKDTNIEDERSSPVSLNSSDIDSAMKSESVSLHTEELFEIVTDEAAKHKTKKMKNL
jgi:hypothetical protein